MANEDIRVPAAGGKQSKKRRGWWWKIPLILILLLALLVLLLPTIASTGPIRRFALARVNQQLPGTLAVDDWSVGWFSGTQASGVTWKDPHGRTVAKVGQITTPVTLSQLARGNYDFGEIVISDVPIDVVVPMTAEKTAQVPPAPNQPATAPPSAKASLPQISGNITVRNVSGHITLVGQAGKEAAINLGKNTALKLDLSKNGRATINGLVELVQPAAPGNIRIDGVVDGIHAGTIDLDQLITDIKLTLENIALAPAGEIAAVAGTPLTTEGSLSGNLQAKSKGLGELSAQGMFSAAHLALSGPALKGDRLVTEKLDLPIDVSVSGSGAAQRLVIRRLGAVSDYGEFGVTTDMPVQSLRDMQDGRPVQDSGNARVTLSIPQLPAILNSLKHTLDLQPGVEIAAGELRANVSADVGADGLKIKAPITLDKLEGVRDGKRIGPFTPISLDASARLASLNKPADLHDIAVKIASSFMNADVQGKTLLSSTAQANVDLVKLRDDLGQVFDLSMIRGGQIAVNIANRSTSEDVLEPDAQIRVTALAVDLPSQPGTPARHLENANITVAAHGRITEQLASLVEAAQIDISTRLVESAQGSAPKVLFDQPISLRVKGDAERQGTPAKIHVQEFSANIGKIAQIALPQGQPLELARTGPRGVTGQMQLSLRADLAAAQQLIAGFTGTSADKLRSGTFAGTASANVAQDGTLKLALHDANADITYIAGTDVHQAIGLNAEASVSPANDHVTASASVKSDVVTVDIPTAELALGTPDHPASAVDMLRSANATINVPDAGRLMRLANAFSGTLPQVTGGKLTADLHITRQGDTTSLTLKADAGEMTISGQTISPTNLAVQASATLPGGELKQVNVDQLALNSDLATVSLAKPIVLSDIPALTALSKGGELPANTQLGGELDIRADLAKLWAFVNAGKQPAYAFAGTLASHPKITLIQRDIALEPQTQITNLRVTQGAKEVVSEPQLGIAGRVLLATAQKTISLDQLAVTSSQGLINLSISGKLSDLGKSNRIENAKVDLTPDLGKLWTIIYAMLPPEQQTKIGEMVLAGRGTDSITISGTYPMDRPPEEAIKSLSVNGSVVVEKVDYKKYGIVAGPISLPFALHDGIATLPSMEPIPCNQGKIDLAGTTLDLTSSTPRLNMPANKRIVDRLQLNQVLVASLGGMVNGLLVDPKEAKGVVNVAVVRCEGMPLGEAMDNANDPGYAEFSVTLRELHLGSKTLDLVMTLMKAQPGAGQDQVTGTIKDARIVIAHGQVSQKADVQLGSSTLGYSGILILKDNTFAPMTLNVPSTMLAQRFDKNLVQYLPERVGLTFTGPANALKLDESTFTHLAQQAVQKQLQSRVPGGKAVTGGLGSILGGGDKEPPAQPAGSRQEAAPASQPSQETKPLDTLKDLFGKPKKK